ncbi:MAG TPA: hypothetical protein DCF68_06690 [Cyanothece sp. UBA12306]|nr:hypothetical protein [Cyanothece sp. UBA12306]
MNSTNTYEANYQKLLLLMQQSKISSLSQLSEVSEVSQWQLNRLLVGLVLKMPIEVILKLSKVLQVSPEELLTQFCENKSFLNSVKDIKTSPTKNTTGELENLKKEYQNLQQKLTQQREILQQEFQKSSLQVLESWLLQWPTAAVVAKKNPQLSAVKLLPLVKPITELLKQWNVETNASVGEKVPYDPQIHELLEGSGEVQPGDLVMVRYLGYCQGETLLYRAKVSPVKQEIEN